MLLEGRITSVVQFKVSDKGKDWGHFLFASKGEVYKCLLFGDKVQLAMKHIVMGDKAIIDGTTMPDSRGLEPTLKVNSFSLPGKKLLDKKLNLSKLTEAETLEYYEAREKEGLVRVYIDGYQKLVRKDRCVKYRGERMEKIEFAMNILGPETVTAYLRENVTNLFGNHDLVLRAVFDLALESPLRDGNVEFYN